mmetsp:Transcript_2850/g.3603  ORF Transcript_2850/g.3603 Transcript_2850/m.3603 type:complete len:292 (-) Transcript_2850:645-1520(-)|eukprot:CAMPEP_0204880442 /NCGR_PEP_ID=MMETSP1349-20130617/1840_1 /ASSEMBLY_ACC=CAM_ASM_000710 /TAXON_ID=215587 /ORGANISM="Aplanochytrium stocchinoi, Strain GSBS06" /LENGTH=291 /DNA_ID=CAMNT_0052038895 /DNA_START=81 /DNA_END=956 /DNA_ORIENTATION=+
MSIELNSVPFFIYAIVALFEAVLVSERLMNGLKEGHPIQWTLCRVFLVPMLLLLMLDDIRLFLGGFWAKDFPEEPAFAWIIYPLLVTHLVFVPVFILHQFEYILAIPTYLEKSPTYISGSIMGITAKRVRIGVGSVTLVLIIIGAYNAICVIQAARQVRLVPELKYGIAKFRPPHNTVIEELGLPVIHGTELVGVVAFSLATVVAGLVFWVQLKWQWYFWAALLAFVGQGSGPQFEKYFFFASNFWEVWIFAAMIFIDYKFLNLYGDDDVDKDKVTKPVVRTVYSNQKKTK